MKTQWYNNWSV